MTKNNRGETTKLSWQKIKLYIAMTCIGSMAFFIGIPIVSQEKVAKILQAYDGDRAAEVIEADDEQS